MRRSEHPPVERGGVMWYHRNYLFDLSQASPHIRAREFIKMLGTDRLLFVDTLTPQIPHNIEKTFALVERVNREAAQTVAGTPAGTWPKRKVIKWRGCYCVRLSDARNKRRVS